MFSNRGRVRAGLSAVELFTRANLGELEAVAQSSRVPGEVSKLASERLARLC